MMGANIDSEFIKKTLENLGCEVSGKKTELNVKTPTYRPDLEREIDLYEEVLRIYGMDKIESSLPKSPKRVGVRTYEQRTTSQIHNVMTASGLHETICYAFAEEEDGPLMGNNQAVELINPMNAQQKYMRQSLIPGLLRCVSYNINRGVSNVSLYEIGVCFYAKEGQQKAKEKNKLACVLSGKAFDDEWNNKSQSFDFFDAKGICENLFGKLNLPKIRYKEVDAEQYKFLQPGRAAEVYSKGALLGWIGEIHPKLCQKFDIEDSVAAFELDMNAVINNSNEISQLNDISVFPGISIDVAFVVDDNITDEMMKQRIRSAGGKLLKSVRLFDVYTSDKHLGKGKKSLAYSLEYRDPEKTLKRDDVDGIHTKLIDKVCKSTGAKIRS